MPTRIYGVGEYFTSGVTTTCNPPVAPASYSAGWNKTTGGVTSCAGDTYKSIPADSSSLSTFNNASGTSGHFTAFNRIVLRRMLAAQTISGNIKGVFRLRQADTTDNFTLAIAIKVVKPDGTDRGVLLAVTASDDTSATPPELSTSNTNRRYRDAEESASIALTSLAVSDGDYLVIEQGIRQDSTSTAAVNFSLPAAKFGSTDALENDTANSGETWVEFDTDLAFLYPQTGVHYYGSTATPHDDAAATGTANPTAKAPPSGMLAGDLVVMVGTARAAGLTLAVSETGGQTWTAHTGGSSTNKSNRVFTCTFNGTWSADPSVSFGSTTCNSVIMHVFRPPSTAYTWETNVAINNTVMSAAATTTITGQTTTGTNPTVTLAGWDSVDDNTWGSLTGTGWEVTGTAQYRNTSSTDQSSTYAHKIQTTAGATGNPAKTQLSLGNDAGLKWILTMAATIPAVNLDGEANSTATATASLSTSIDLSASVSATSTSTANLTLPGPSAVLEAAVAAAASVISANITTAIRLNAVASAESVISGAALMVGVKMATSTAAAATATGALTNQIRFAATASGVATAEAALTSPALLATSSSGFASATGALTTSIRVASSVAALATTTANVTNQIRFTASASAVATATANLTAQPGSMSCDAAALVTATANLTNAIRLVSSVASVATSSAALTTAIKPAASVAAVATTSANLTTAIRLAGSVAAVATVTGAPTIQITLASSRQAVATASASTINTAIRLAASVSTSPAVTATIGGTPAVLAGALQVNATATGALSTAIRLAASVAATASHSATVTGVAAALAATRSATATATANLTGTIKLGTTVAASTNVASASLTAQITMDGQAQAVAYCEPALLFTQNRIEGYTSGFASATGALSTGILMTGIATAVVTPATQLTAVIQLNAQAANEASAASTVDTSILLAASAQARAYAQIRIISLGGNVVMRPAENRTVYRPAENRTALRAA